MGLQHHILVLNSPMHGHITPSLGVVAQLVERGHRVTYITTDHFERAVAASGAEVLRYESSRPTAITMAEKDDGSSYLINDTPTRPIAPDPRIETGSSLSFNLRRVFDDPC